MVLFQSCEVTSFLKTCKLLKRKYASYLKNPSSKIERRFYKQCTLSGIILTSDRYHAFIYTRQNKLRVTPRSKQCNSIFGKMPGLIPISDCYNDLTDDTLGTDEQFPVKIFFSKNLIFEILKILIFNPNSLNFYFLWLINHFPIRLEK